MARSKRRSPLRSLLPLVLIVSVVYLLSWPWVKLALKRSPEQGSPYLRTYGQAWVWLDENTPLKQPLDSYAQWSGVTYEKWFSPSGKLSKASWPKVK